MAAWMICFWKIEFLLQSSSKEVRPIFGSLLDELLDVRLLFFENNARLLHRRAAAAAVLDVS